MSVVIFDVVIEVAWLRARAARAVESFGGLESSRTVTIGSLQVFNSGFVLYVCASRDIIE